MKTIKCFVLIAVLYCALIFTTAAALCHPTERHMPEASAPTVNGDDVFIGSLDNGMDVVLVPNHSVPMIACNIIIKAGAREETWETWGAAHFLEHLLFNGTVNRTQEEIYEEFDLIGAYDNAHTGSHLTDFMLLAPRENFQLGFEILADMVFSSNLPEEKFEKERGIVMEEIARSKTYGFDSDQPFKEWLFGDKAQSREVLGTVESIARLERDSVMAFYHRWFVPNNMMLFVSGDFRSDTLFTWFQEALSIYRPHELPAHVKLTPPDFKTLSARGLQIVNIDGNQRILKAALPIPEPGSPDFPCALMVSMMLQRFIADHLPAGLKGSVYNEIDPDYAFMEITLSGAPDGMSGAKMSKVLNGILNDFTRHIPKKPEIAALALRYRADQIFTSEKLHYYGIMNSGYWALVPWMEFTSWEDRLVEIKPGELSRTIKELLKKQPRAELVLEPTSPSTSKQTFNADEQRVVRRTLDNGMTVAVRSDPSAKVFAMHILAKNRWKWDGRKNAGMVDLLHRLITEDNGKSTPLDRQLDRLAATLKTVDSPYIPYDNYYTTPNYSFIRLEILPEKWKEGISLVVDRMSRLPTNPECLESAKAGAKNATSGAKRIPTEAGRMQLRQRLLPDNALSASVYGDVKDVPLEELQNLRTKYFHPGNLIVTVSGPVEADRVITGLQEAFVELEKTTDGSPVLSATIAKFADLVPESNVRDSLNLGLMQGAVVMGKRISKIDEDDVAALIIANAYFNDRLGMVLREEKGLAYGLSSSVSTHRSNGGMIWGYWEISMATRPENLEQAETGIHELLTEIQTHEFTEREIEKLVNSINGRLLMRDMPRIGQAYAMGVGEFFWNDPERRQHISEMLKKLNPTEVQFAAKSYLIPDEMSVIIVR